MTLKVKYTKMLLKVKYPKIGLKVKYTKIGLKVKYTNVSLKVKYEKMISKVKYTTMMYKVKSLEEKVDILRNKPPQSFVDECNKNKTLHDVEDKSYKVNACMNGCL